MARNFGFVFARGGSKGLPGKNIRPFHGKPLIAHSIEVALAVDEIEEVFVSTDDEEIEAVAEEFGARLIRRPEKLATDTASEILAWQHAVSHCEAEFGQFDGFVSLPATSPLRSHKDVVNAIQERDKSEADCCIGITPANRSPYFNMVTLNDEGFADVMIKPNENLSRRQDTPACYDVTTVVYAATTAYVKKTSSLFEGKIATVQIPKQRAVDIDDIYDFRFAEVLYESR